MPLTVQLFVISLLLWSKLKVAAYQSQESKWLRIKLQTNNLKVSLILTHKHANLTRTTNKAARAQSLQK